MGYFYSTSLHVFISFPFSSITTVTYCSVVRSFHVWFWVLADQCNAVCILEGGSKTESIHPSGHHQLEEMRGRYRAVGAFQLFPSPLCLALLPDWHIYWPTAALGLPPHALLWTHRDNNHGEPITFHGFLHLPPPPFVTQILSWMCTASRFPHRTNSLTWVRAGWCPLV